MHFGVIRPRSLGGMSHKVYKCILLKKFFHILDICTAPAPLSLPCRATIWKIPISQKTKLQPQLLENIFFILTTEILVEFRPVQTTNTCMHPKEYGFWMYLKNADLWFMCGFSGYQALAYNEVHTSVCSLNRSEFNQDFSHEDEKNIFQQLWLQFRFLWNRDFLFSNSRRQTYGAWRAADKQVRKKLF